MASESVYSTFDIRMRKAAALTLLTAPILGGVFIGTSLADRSELNANVADARKAAGFGRCIAFEQAMGTGKVVLRASQIPVSIQKDCGVRDGIVAYQDNTKRYLETVDPGMLAGSSITIYTDPSITLPSLAALNEARHSAISASETTGYGSSIGYGVTGAFAGLISVSAAIALNLNLREREQRRIQNESVAQLADIIQLREGAPFTATRIDTPAPTPSA